MIKGIRQGCAETRQQKTHTGIEMSLQTDEKCMLKVQKRRTIEFWTFKRDFKQHVAIK